MTGFRMFPDDRMTPALQRSLSALVLQRLGEPEAYALVSLENCRLLIWKDASTNHISEKILVDFARYIQDNFHIQMGVVSMLAGLADAQMARLDRYPGPLDEGFDRLLGNAAPLLRELGLEASQKGLWEMTGHICAGAEEWLYQSVARARQEIHKVMDYIQTHLPEDLSCEQLSRLIHYESVYFSRLFKAETGVSCADYLFQSQILRAQEMLRGTGDPISRIAAMCGFSDLSYFSARFRQFCGMTPREWREINGEATV